MELFLLCVTFSAVQIYDASAVYFSPTLLNVFMMQKKHFCRF